MTGNLLIVDDEKIALKNLEHVMKKEGYAVTTTPSGANALSLLEQQAFDVVLTDLKMEKVDGLQILQKCREHYPHTEVIVITGFATVESAIDAMKQGAYHYIAKPFRLDEVRKVVCEAWEKIRLRRENQQLRDQLEQFQGRVRFITQDIHLQHLLETARQIAGTDCNVILSGETGTGKELLARYLHFHSHRAPMPLVAVNCGAFQAELLANELFGHEKGAFTGAQMEKKGLLEAAHGGTLFLDEITEMTSTMQVKLLRVIQEREVLRLGSTRPIPIDVRFLVATHRNLQQAVQAGDFRQDLYYRLNVVTLQLPPLVKRKADIPLLSFHLLQKHATLMKKPVTNISKETLELLMNYDFPGNVRELENLIERGVAVTTSDTIEVVHLPEDLRKLTIRTFRKQAGRIPTLDEQEKEYIQWVMREANGNQTQAAQWLGIDRVSLWRKLKRYQLASSEE